MLVFCVVEHWPYIANEGYEETITCICETRDKAQQIADDYNKEYAPYYYTIYPCEVM